VADFWRMVWEKQVFVIVKITKCVELGKRKCAQYWPDDGSMKYGNIAVQVVHTQNCEGYDLRTIKLQSKVEIILAMSASSRQIRQDTLLFQPYLNVSMF